MQTHCKIIGGFLVASLVFCSMANADVSTSDCQNTTVQETHSVSMRVIGDYATFISGDAGSGTDAPNYSSAFEPGFGVGIEGDFKPAHSSLSYHLGVAYMDFNGDTYKGIKFDNLTYTDLYAGVKWHFFESKSKVDSYVRCDLGVSFMEKVKIDYKGLDVDYWDKTTGWMIGAGLGTTYMWTEHLGGFLEVNFRYRQAPDENFSAADADSNLTMPIMFGIEYRF